MVVCCGEVKCKIKTEEEMKKEENTKERVWDSPAKENRSDLQFTQSDLLMHKSTWYLRGFRIRMIYN